MTTSTAHLRADELLRFIDNDATPLERSQFSSHLLACTRCADEAGAVREDAALFAATLRAAAWEDELPARPSFAAIVAARQARASAGVVPLRRAWRGVPAWARAAAVLLVVAGPVAAVPAWRDWLVQTLTGGADVTDSAVAPQVQAAPEGAGTRVGFVPAGPTFTVQFDAAQAAGELRISLAASASEGTLAMENAASEEPIYSASTLRIRNSSVSAATYVLALPQSVRTVRVRVGEADVRTVGAEEIAGGVVVPLRR